MTGYRRRFYESYVSGYLGTYRPISKEAFERDRWVYQRLFGRLLPGGKDAQILEIGCGYGSFLHFLQQEGYRNVRGIDLSDEQVRVARALGVRDVQTAEAGAYLQEHPQTFDLIAALDLLEHLTKEEVPAVLDAVFAALQPRGRLLLHVPNGDSPFASRLRYADFTHELVFTPSSIRQVLHASGFTDVHVFPVEPIAHGVASAVRWLLWKGIKQLIRLYLLVDQGVPGSGVFTANLVAVAHKP